MNKEIVSYDICCGETLIWASTDINEAIAYYKELGGNEGCFRFVVTFHTIIKSCYWN